MKYSSRLPVFCASSIKMGLFLTWLSSQTGSRGKSLALHHESCLQTALMLAYLHFASCVFNTCRNRK